MPPIVTYDIRVRVFVFNSQVHVGLIGVLPDANTLVMHVAAAVVVVVVVEVVLIALPLAVVGIDVADGAEDVKRYD